MMRVSLIVTFVLMAACAHAQTVINPTQIQFTHADFAWAQSYNVGYFSSLSAPSPVQVGTLAKPSSCSPCSGLLPSRPTAFQTWYVAVQGVGVDVNNQVLLTAWSSPYVPFVSAPLSPTAVVVKP